MSIKRDYVIVCNRYKGLAGSLLFWGIHTEDNEERSFGGYTSDLNNCEKYALGEFKEDEFPIYEGNKDKWEKYQDFAIRIDQLKELGYRPMLIYYR